ncbi:putative msx2-interacting protein, partial [Triplophysa rosa]
VKAAPWSIRREPDTSRKWKRSGLSAVYCTGCLWDVSLTGMKMERPLRRSSLSTLHAKLHPPKRRSICLNRQVKGLMRKKQTTTNLDERFSLSGECQDLLSRCLNLSEVHRATLQQILEHEWFQVQLEPKPPCPLPQHKALPTPHGFTGQYEKGESLKFGRMWSCTRKVDGQNISFMFFISFIL